MQKIVLYFNHDYQNGKTTFCIVTIKLFKHSAEVFVFHSSICPCLTDKCYCMFSHVRSQIYFTGRLISHFSIKSMFSSLLITCRDLCHHLMTPLRLDIIQPMLLHTTIPGSPVLHRLHIRYVKLLIVQYPYGYILYIKHPPSSKQTSLLHILTSCLTFSTSSDQCRQLLPLLVLLSCTRVQVI